VVFLAEDVGRDELRGDLAAEVFAAADVLVDLDPFPFDEVERVDLAPPPLADVFDLADVVLRAEDDLELPVFEEPADFEPPRDELLLEELLLDEPVLDELLREEPADLLPLADLRLVAAAPFLPAALFCTLLPPRLDVLLLLRPPVEDFLVDEDPLLADLRLVAAAPFLPAALFFADVLLELLDEPPEELFELLLDDLRFVAAAPFLPAALF